jgi:Transglutaminase-like superfamily
MRLRSYADLYGSPCTRAVLAVGWSTFRYEADVEISDATEDADESAREVAPEELPDDALIYTLPSRYCLPDVLGNEAWTLFGSHPRGYQRVQAICDHVHAHLTFRYGSSTAWSTAADVNSTRLGVCRDFTQLAIWFCRALNIPARYVFGYLPDMDVPIDPAPMDFAARTEVWLGDRWWTFDPRNNARRKGRVWVGQGRDASDVAMATTFGGPRLDSMTTRLLQVAPGGATMASGAPSTGQQQAQSAQDHRADHDAVEEQRAGEAGPVVAEHGEVPAQRLPVTTVGQHTRDTNDHGGDQDDQPEKNDDHDMNPVGLRSRHSQRRDRVDVNSVGLR